MDSIYLLRILSAAFAGFGDDEVPLSVTDQTGMAPKDRFGTNSKEGQGIDPVLASLFFVKLSE